jgi:phytoene synthase
MQQLYDKVSFETSKLTTRSYSNSFSLAVSTLNTEMQDAIYSIYGFVRLADEIVDTFHNYNKKELLDKFESDYYDAVKHGISLNLILHSFQLTVKKYDIQDDFIQSFLKSMRADLVKNDYISKNELEEYVYGSADVVGLMCLKVFVNGNNELFEQMRKPAMRLGSAFQKVNFLRDLKNDMENLGRHYFPGIDFTSLNESSKKAIIEDIETDFRASYEGIKILPAQAKIGVNVAYVYYKSLLRKIKHTPAEEIISRRIRISNFFKLMLLIRCILAHKIRIVNAAFKAFFLRLFIINNHTISVQEETNQVASDKKMFGY